MTAPLELTFSTLQNSKNDAASAVLAAALDIQNGMPMTSAIRAALRRRGKMAHAKLLARWHELDPSDQDLVSRSCGHISAALRDAIVSADTQTFTNACEVIARTDEFDLVPTLVTVAEHLDNPHSKTATALVVSLTERLSKQLLRAESEVLARDPRLFRKNIVQCLQRSIERYRYHKLDAIVEAFLLLCDSNDYTLMQMLDDPHHPCFQTLSHVLTKSTQQKIIKLVLDLLVTEKPPVTLLSVVSHRTDLPFVKQLFEFCATSTEPSVKRNLKQLRNLSWLGSATHKLSQFDERLQFQAVDTLTATSVPQDKLLAVLEELLANGQTEGRTAACNALEKISGERTNKLILRATNDPAIEVKAAAIRQLRMRHIPGTMPLLERMLDSPVPQLQDAAREALAEFTFAGYLKDYDLLHEEIRLTTGRLVQKVDLQYLQGLKAEFSSQVVKRRLRAIEIARMLRVIPQVMPQLLQLSEDEDHFVRTAAAEALSECPTSEALEALEIMTSDRSGSVRNTAREGLAAIDARRAKAEPFVEESSL